MKHIEVVAAVIKKEGKYLCMQRGLNKYDYISKKFEFPGGKIEKGESEIDALHREINEELNIKIEIKGKLITVNHTYNDFSITMHCFMCCTDAEFISLKDHIDYKWLTKGQLIHLDWAAADIPVLEHLD